MEGGRENKKGKSQDDENLERILNTCTDVLTLGMIMQRTIREELEARGIDSRGSKDVLIARLIDDNTKRGRPKPSDEADAEHSDSEGRPELDANGEGDQQRPPILIPQIQPGQTLDMYMAQFMGAFGMMMQQNQLIQEDLRKQQLQYQRQLQQMGQRNIEIHTTPDLYTSIPEFHGKRTESAQTWLNILERMATQQGWTPSTSLSTAASKLRGEAKDWHDTSGSCIQNWQDWKDMLVAQFSKPLSFREWTSLIESRNQSSLETLTEYMRAKLKIANLNPVEIPTKDKLDYLVSGISDKTIAHMLKLQHFNDVYELLEAAREIDESNEMDRKKGAKTWGQPSSYIQGEAGGKQLSRFSQPTTFQRGNDVTSYPQANQYRTQINKKTLFRRGMNKQDATCFNCQRKGHLAFECDRPQMPRPRTNSRTERPPQAINCVFKSKENHLPVIEGIIGENKKVNILLDSGSEVSLIDEKLLPGETTIDPWNGKDELVILGTQYQPKGVTCMSVQIADIIENLPFYVVDNAPFDVLLGADWRRKANVKLTVYPDCSVKVKKHSTSMTTAQSSDEGNVLKVGCVQLRVRPFPSGADDLRRVDGMAFISPNTVEQIQKVVEKCHPDVPESARERLKSILTTHVEAFTTSERTLGQCGVEHRIHLKNEVPVKSRPYRYSPADQDFINETVEKWKEKGIIEDSASDFASPAIIVEQPYHPSTPRRLCIDYRKLNESTIKVNFPIPIIDDVIARMTEGDSEFFNVMDIKTAFMTVDIHKEDKHKTAFVTEEGQYQFLRMPFGLSNAPSTMQSIMNKTYRNIPRTSTYMDDIGQGGKTADQALDVFETVLDRTIENGLLMDLQKCQILQKSVKFLGYIVDRMGKTPDPERTSSVDRLDPPKTVKQTRSFVQFASHYRRFIKDFAKLARPLYDILKKDKKFHWSDECQMGFEELCERLKSPPILAHFERDAKTRVYVDAAQNGLGAVLTQIQDGKEVAIEYASQSVSEQDRKLHSNALECLAVHWAVSEKFRIYLYGAPPFEVLSDNWSVSYLMTKSLVNRRFARWTLDLQEFSFSVKHLPGEKNVVADMLSRANHKITAVVVMAHDSRLRDAQKSDHYCIEILETLAKEPRTKQDRKTHLDFEQCEDVLMRKLENKGQTRSVIVVPTSLQAEVMRMCHEKGGHMDTYKTVNRIATKYWWPTLNQKVKHFVETCTTCQEMNRRTTRSQGKLNSLQLPEEPYVMISLDHIGPLERVDDYTHILISVDHTTRHVIAAPVASTGAANCIEFFEDRIITVYGTPTTVVSDCGTGFVSKRFQDFLKRKGISHIRTPAYWPESNGLVERYVATIKSVLRKTLGDRGDWPDLVRNAAMAINTSFSKSLANTPFFLLHGYVPRISDELLIGSVTDDLSRAEQLEYLKVDRQDARDHLSKSRIAMKKRYDRSHTEADIDIGDKVLYAAGSRTHAMAPLYEGPFVVTDRISENIYRIQREEITPERCDIKTAHAGQLKRWKMRDPGLAFQENHTHIESEQEDEGDPHYPTPVDDPMPPSNTTRERRRTRLPDRFKDFELNVNSLFD